MNCNLTVKILIDCNLKLRQQSIIIMMLQGIRSLGLLNVLFILLLANKRQLYHVCIIYYLLQKALNIMYVQAKNLRVAILW